MKIHTLLSLATLALPAGCAHTAQHYQAPNAAPMETSSRKLAAEVEQSAHAVALASDAVKKASTAVDSATKSHTAEAAEVSVIEPKLSDLFRVAPPELRPIIHEIQGEVEVLKSDQEATATTLATAQDAQASAEAAQGVATQTLAEATAEKDRLAKLEDSYVAETAALTDRANKAEAGWAKDSAQLVWYKEHWWGAWIMLGAALLACALFAFLKFTGRLALSGAAIAAKI